MFSPLFYTRYRAWPMNPIPETNGEKPRNDTTLKQNFHHNFTTNFVFKNT